MAQLDTRIALGAQPPSSSGTSPFRTLGQLAQLREQQSLNRQRDLVNQQHQRALDDDAAVRDTLSRHGSVDDAIDDLYHQGLYEPAGAISKQVFEARKSAGEALTEKNKNDDRRITLVAQALQGVTDQASLGTANDVAKKLTPEYAQYLPTEYGDGSEVKRLIALATKRSEFLTQQNEAVNNALKAGEMSLKAHDSYDARQKAKQDANAYWARALSISLGQTQNQDEWDNTQRLAVGEMGAPPEIAAQFGREWSPAAVARAKQLGLTPAERESAANAKANTALREREVKVREQTAGDGTPASRPLTPNAKSTIERSKATRYDQFEKDARNPDPSQGGTSLFERAGQGDEGAKQQMAQRKLQIENDARAQQGQPTLEQAEREYAETPGADAKLRQIRGIYHNLTGDDTPMEKADKLFAQLQTEKDPVKIKALRQQLAAARQAADAAAGR